MNVEIAANVWVKHGTGSAEVKKIKGCNLIVVSAELLNGHREDIDSSLCPFITQAVLRRINGPQLATQV